MAEVIKSTTKVVASMKRVKEEILRYQYEAATHNIAAGVERELYSYGGTPGDRHDVRIGECEELLAFGIDPAYHAATGGFIDQLRATDRDGSEWNKFLTIPALVRMNANQLPFNSQLNFERQMMSWGYRSFLSSPIDLAATWKLPEGDDYRFLIHANAAGAVNSGNNRAFAVVRRYLAGSDVDFRHFNQYDGGLKSNKRYYNDVQYLATTVVNQQVQAWRLQILRNEAYKFFQGGVLPDVTYTYAKTSHLLEARIMIDDPMTEYNKYFVNHNYNILPFVNSSFIFADSNGAGAPDIWPLERMHRFAPTIDILKNRNKDLTVYVQDDGVVATEIYVNMIGVKYQI